MSDFLSCVQSEEEFSSDEDENNDDEVAKATSAGETAAEEAEAAVEGKIIRRQRGKRKHSDALVQQRVISVSYHKYFTMLALTCAI